MIKKTITYIDYDGNEVSEDCYFNLTAAEITKMNIAAEAENIDTKDTAAVVRFYEKIILGAYGTKAADGKHFYHDDASRDEFASSLAYDALFMDLMSDENALTDFITGIVPKALAEKLVNAGKAIDNQ